MKTVPTEEQIAEKTIERKWRDKNHDPKQGDSRHVILDNQRGRKTKVHGHNRWDNNENKQGKRKEARTNGVNTTKASALKSTVTGKETLQKA